MAVTSGSYTIKTSGGDYTTWAAALNDIGNLTGNLTFTVDASAFTESSAPAAVTDALGGYTLTIQSASYPTTTDASTGARFTWNTNGTFFQNEMEGAGTVIIQGIVFIQGSGTPDEVFFITSINTAFNFIIRRNIVKGGYIALYLNDNTPNLSIYNNIIFDQSRSIGEYGTRAIVNVAGFVSNNTFVDIVGGTAGGIGIGSGFSRSGTYENNLVYNTDTADYSDVVNATGNNNSSSDDTADDFGTGSNNRINKTTSPFTNYAADDFTLAAGSDPIGNGKDLSASFTTDFFGNTRSTWDIGACAYVSASSSITPHELYYRRRRAA